MVEADRHENINIFTYTEIERVEGEPGDYTITLLKKPRYIIEDKCTGCNICVEYCPVLVPDPYNQGLSDNKAIHIYFSLAVPLITYIDENCMYLKEKKCRLCENVCENKAIDFTQKPERITVKVGAVILSSGFEIFNPALRNDYGYGIYKNVITSLDFERLLSSTGPFEGEIRRPSDKKHPKKIAWIQCVGSRQVNPPGGNPYCSAVCCTYTQKQVILTKEHDEDTEITIFHNDIRAYGKDFERYFERAKSLPGVKFIRSYVSVDKEDPETGNITIKYATTNGVKKEEFDLVVLSVGMNHPVDAKELSEKFGVELNEFEFCKISPDNPLKTSKEGIFVSGAFMGPSDIPEAVYSASGAGSLCGEFLNYRRGKLVSEKEYPPQIDVSGKEPRIGIFVCHCGANISRVVNVPEVVEYASKLPNVVHCQEQLFSCTTNSAKEIIETIHEKNLNRVIIAACSPRTLEQLFRDTMKEAGLNQYLLEMVNIREHCSWVHQREKELATEKAKDIIRMGVARANHLEPLQEFELPVDKKALIVGGGVAGLTCAISIAEQGHEVYIIEKEKQLGGIARRLYSTIDGLDVKKFLDSLIKKVYKNPHIHIYTSSEIVNVSGYVGNFETTIKINNFEEKTIKHGAVVIAIGAEEYKPEEYNYDESENILTQIELGELIVNDLEKIKNLQSVVMIQCVGCRNEDRNYCSRVCCSHAIKNALKLKEINSEIDVYILYRDMRTYGYFENYYREAADKEVRFIRYDLDNKPEVSINGDKINVVITDPILEKKLLLEADILTLSAAVIPAKDSEKIAQLYKVPLNPDGFFKEAHVKLRPVEFPTEGVYLAGTAHYPKHIHEVISQAYGAAGRVLTLLSHDSVTASGAVCEVDEKKCMGCGACIDVCSYGAIEFKMTKQGKKASVNPILCKGDGLCNAKCPTGAIQLKHYTDEQLECQIDVLTKKEILDIIEKAG